MPRDPRPMPRETVMPGGGAQAPVMPPPITSAPVMPPPITSVPQPTPNDPSRHPGNRRWREARARGMTAQQFQQQGQVPNTAQLQPQGQPFQPTGAPIPQGQGNILPPQAQQPMTQPMPQGQPQVTGPQGGARRRPQPQPAQTWDDARVAAQRQYFS